MRRFWVAVALTGCGPDPGFGSVAGENAGMPQEETASTSGSTSGDGSMPSGSASTGASTGEAASSSGPSEGMGTFITDDSGPVCGGRLPSGVLAHCSRCSPDVQDCPVGDACKPWSNDGGDSWNSTRCVPVPPDAGQRGEPCTAEGSPYSAVDSCDIGLMCWDVDAETLKGKCIEFCGPHPDFACEVDGETCSIGNHGALRLCLPSCDPLAAECEEGLGCYPGSEGNFVCLPEGQKVSDGDVFHPLCPAGTFWGPLDRVEDCSKRAPCCSEFCDLSVPLSCGEEATCVPYFEPAVAEHPDLGYCRPDA